MERLEPRLLLSAVTVSGRQYSFIDAQGQQQSVTVGRGRARVVFNDLGQGRRQIKSIRLLGNRAADLDVTTGLPRLWGRKVRNVSVDGDVDLFRVDYLRGKITISGDVKRLYTRRVYDVLTIGGDLQTFRGRALDADVKVDGWLTGLMRVVRYAKGIEVNGHLRGRVVVGRRLDSFELDGQMFRGSVLRIDGRARSMRFGDDVWGRIKAKWIRALVVNGCLMGPVTGIDRSKVQENCQPDQAPAVVRPLADVTVPAGTTKREISLAGVFADPDDPVEALTYSVSGNTNPGLFKSLTTFPAPHELLVEFAAGVEGSSTVTVRATDPSGLFAETSFEVTVQPAAVSQFTGLGPGGGGATFSAVFHNTDPNIILVGQDVGGISRTTDGGQTWQHVNQNGISGPQRSADVYGITELVAHPANNDVFFAWTWAGLFRSEDAGVHWQEVIPEVTGGCLAVSPADPNLVIAGTGDWRDPAGEGSVGAGLWRSTDGGRTFKKLANSGVPNSAICGGAAFDPANNSVWLATSRGLYRSTDGGLTYSLVNGPFAHRHGQWIGVAGTAQQRVFWYVLNTKGRSGRPRSWKGGIYRSTDGLRWVKVPGQPQVWVDPEGDEDPTLLQPAGSRIDPADPNVLYVNLVAMEDGGGNVPPGMVTVPDEANIYRYDGTGWKRLINYNREGWPRNVQLAWNKDWMSGGLAGMAISPSDPNQILIMHEGGVWKSEDHGATWTDVSSRRVGNRWSGTGAELTYAYDLEVSDGILYAAYEDMGVWRSDDAGASWRQIWWYLNDRGQYIDLNNDGGSEIHANPTDGQRIYFGASSWSFGVREGGQARIYKSTDGGLTLQNITPPRRLRKGRRGRPALAIVWGPTPQQDTLYVAFHGDTIYKSTNGGATWRVIDSSLSRADRRAIFRIAVHPNNVNLVYLGLSSEAGMYSDNEAGYPTSGGLYRSTNAGASWSRVAGYPYKDVVTLKFVGSPVRLFVGARTYRRAEGLFVGALTVSDDGLTFKQVLRQPFVNDVISKPGSPRTLYAAAAGTYVAGRNQRPGIYRSTDNGNTWELILENLPHNYLLSLAILPDAVDRILIGTSGDGIIGAKL